MVSHQKRQLSFLRQHGPLDFFLAALVVVGYGLALPALDVFPADFEFILVFVVARLIPRVVDPQQSPSDFCAAEIVDRQVGAALVFVLEPAEALGLARLLVAHELEEHRFAELGEDRDDVAFGEVVGEAAKVDKGRVAVVDVPGRVW